MLAGNNAHRASGLLGGAFGLGKGDVTSGDPDYDFDEMHGGAVQGASGAPSILWWKVV